MTDPVDAIIAILRDRGGRRYGGERVSQLQHALQAAALAEADGADTPLVAAALLHDVGHLLGDGDEGAAARGIDARHEHVGADWLKQWFGDEVTMPVRLHVDAKRFLCADEPGHFATLSPASVRSLEVQGGPMNADEAARFRSGAHAAAAIRLRRWDEAAKDPQRPTPSLEHFRRHLGACRRSGD
jgi:gamma-butyrobetaine dioxygenase